MTHCSRRLRNINWKRNQFFFLNWISDMAAPAQSWLSLWMLPLAAGGRHFARTCSERQFLGSRLKQRQLGWQEKWSQVLCCNQLKAKKGTVSYSDTEFLLPCGLQEELLSLLSPGVPASYYTHKTKPNQKQTEKNAQNWRKKKPTMQKQAIKNNFDTNCPIWFCFTVTNFPLQNNSYGRFLPA